MRIQGITAAIAAALSLMSCRTMSEEPLARASLAVTNVTVIDPETRRLLPRHTIYVGGDRILAVLPSTAAPRFVAERTIDGSGKFVIPGLMDMHVHMFLPEPSAPTLNLLLANGVTGMREMSGDCWEVAGDKEGCIADYRAIQSHLKSGAIPGPDILALTSTMVMGPSRITLPAEIPSFVVPQTEADARLVVRHLHGRGVDLIKTHDSIPTAVFTALMAEANKLGVEVSGHVPFAAGSLGAARMGYRSIEHARDLLYDCSRYGAEFRREEAAFADGQPGAKRPTNVTRLTRTVAEYDPALCAPFLQKLAATGVYYVPTHVTREMEARADDAAYRADHTRKYVMPGRATNWEADLVQTAALPPAERAALKGFFRHGLTVTGLAHRAGVAVMAGTDTNDTMIVPGFSLHRELGLLAQAGLTPMDVLRAATTVPAAYLRKNDLYGGVSSGKEADLVLLNASPLDDIRNSADIFAVINNGRAYDRAALDALLAEVEAAARKP